MNLDDAIERSMLREELRELLRDFDIPAMRRPLNKANLRWMGRNLQIKNGDHKDFDRAKKLIKEILKGLKF